MDLEPHQYTTDSGTYGNPNFVKMSKGDGKDITDTNIIKGEGGTGVKIGDQSNMSLNPERRCCLLLYQFMRNVVGILGWSDSVFISSKIKNAPVFQIPYQNKLINAIEQLEFVKPKTSSDAKSTTTSSSSSSSGYSSKSTVDEDESEMIGKTESDLIDVYKSSLRMAYLNVYTVQTTTEMKKYLEKTTITAFIGDCNWQVSFRFAQLVAENVRAIQADSMGRSFHEKKGAEIKGRAIKMLDFFKNLQVKEIDDGAHIIMEREKKIINEERVGRKVKNTPLSLKSGWDLGDVFL